MMRSAGARRGRGRPRGERGGTQPGLRSFPRPAPQLGRCLTRSFSLVPPGSNAQQPSSSTTSGGAGRPDETDAEECGRRVDGATPTRRSILASAAAVGLGPSPPWARAAAALAAPEGNGAALPASTEACRQAEDGGWPPEWPLSTRTLDLCPGEVYRGQLVVRPGERVTVSLSHCGDGRSPQNCCTQAQGRFGAAGWRSSVLMMPPMSPGERGRKSAAGSADKHDENHTTQDSTRAELNSQHAVLR